MMEDELREKEDGEINSTSEKDDSEDGEVTFK